MITSRYFRHLIIASLLVSMPVRPMGNSFSTKAKLGIGVVAALAAFVGYRAWTYYKDRESREARRQALAAIAEMRIFDYKGLRKFNPQDAHTAQLFNNINYLGLLINGEDLDEILLNNIKSLLGDPFQRLLDDSGNSGAKILLSVIKPFLDRQECCANPDMIYQDLKPKLTYFIPNLSSDAARLRGDEMPLEERPITLLAKKLMLAPVGYVFSLGIHGYSDRLQLIRLIHAHSKLPLDVTDHEGNIRKIIYMDSNDAAFIASLNQRRYGRRDAVHEATKLPDVLSDVVFCYDDPLMKDHPIPLKSGNAVLASWSERLVASDDEKEVVSNDEF